MSGVLAAIGGGPAPGTITTTITSGSDTSPATFEVGSSGNYVNGAAVGDWVTPATSANAAFYQVKVDPTTGSFSSGTTGTFLDCSTPRTYTKSSGAVTFTVTFREKATQIVRSIITDITLTGT